MVLVLNNVCSKHGGKQMGNFRTDLESYIELIKELTGATKVSITLEFSEKVSTPKETIAEPLRRSFLKRRRPTIAKSLNVVKCPST